MGSSRRALIKKHGCQPIKGHAEINGFPNNVVGIKTLQENLAHGKNGSFLQNVKRRYRDFGNTFFSRVLLTEMWSTIEPENLKTMMALNFKEWQLDDRRKSSFLPLLGHGIFTTDGAAWQHSRELLRPNFSRSQVGDLATFETHVRNLIEAIPRDGSTINLQDLFFQLTMDSATEFLFGESTGCLATGKTSERNLKFAEAFNRSQEMIGEIFRSGMVGELMNRTKILSESKTVHDFADHFVQKGLEYRQTLDLSKGPPLLEESERYVFLNELVKRTADPVQIRSELLNILLAGRDTTASLLSNVWFILARRPDIWKKLKSEVDELGGEVPTFEQIKEMKYMRKVLNECKPHHPSLLQILSCSL